MSNETPSYAVFLDPKDCPETYFPFPPAGKGVTRSVTTVPIAIPGAKGARPRSQRHTNFTPPRSYIGEVERSIVRSKSVGSISTAVSFLVKEHVHPCRISGAMQAGSTDSMPHVAERSFVGGTSKSFPNFDRAVLEQGIGQELRMISDCFHLEFSGFGHGYDYVHSPTRIYSSSYPGCVRDSGASTSNWQNVVTSVCPGGTDQTTRLGADLMRLNRELDCSGLH